MLYIYFIFYFVYFLYISISFIPVFYILFFILVFSLLVLLLLRQISPWGLIKYLSSYLDPNEPREHQLCSEVKSEVNNGRRSVQRVGQQPVIKTKFPSWLQLNPPSPQEALGPNGRFCWSFSTE